MVLKATLINLSISFKSNNQGLIAFVHNLVYYTQKKHIDIQYHFIRDKVAARQINFQYIPTTKMIVNRLTKAFTHAKFNTFVKQIDMN